MAKANKRMESIKALVQKARENETVKDLLSERPDAIDNDFLHALCVVRCRELNTLLGQESCHPTAVPTAISAVNEVVKAHNDLTKLDKLNTLAGMEPADAFKVFMADQSVSGGVTFEQDENTYYIKTGAKLALTFYDFLKVTLPSFELNGLLDMAAIIGDNIARVDCALDGAHVTKACMTESYRDLRARLGWDLSAEDNSLNKTQVRNQMNELAQRLIPKGSDIEIKFINADFRFIKESAIEAVDRANKPGEYVLRKESTLLNFFFRAMYTRYNRLAYNFQEKGVRAFEKGVRTQKQNKADKAQTEKPEAGDVKTMVSA